MRKLLAITLVCTSMLALAACGKDSGDAKDPTKTPDNPTVSTPSPTPTKEPEITGPKDALELLTTVWNSYTEDQKFPAAGGDFNDNHNVMDAPGIYGVEDTAALDSVFGLPAAQATLIDNAASLLHMMNANTFTSGAYHVTKADDVSVLADAMKENIANRQWICGFPDKLVIITVQDYVVSAFGAEELIDTFRDNVLTCFTGATVSHEISLLD